MLVRKLAMQYKDKDQIKSTIAIFLSILVIYIALT